MQLEQTLNTNHTITKAYIDFTTPRWFNKMMQQSNYKKVRYESQAKVRLFSYIADVLTTQMFVKISANQKTTLKYDELQTLLVSDLPIEMKLKLVLNTNWYATLHGKLISTENRERIIDSIRKIDKQQLDKFTSTCWHVIIFQDSFETI